MKEWKKEWVTEQEYRLDHQKMKSLLHRISSSRLNAHVSPCIIIYRKKPAHELLSQQTKIGLYKPSKTKIKITELYTKDI